MGIDCKKKQSFPKHLGVLDSHNWFFTESEYNLKKAQNSSFCCQRKRLPNPSCKSSPYPDSWSVHSVRIYSCSPNPAVHWSFWPLEELQCFSAGTQTWTASTEDPQHGPERSLCPTPFPWPWNAACSTLQGGKTAPEAAANRWANKTPLLQPQSCWEAQGQAAAEFEDGVGVHGSPAGDAGVRALRVPPAGSFHRQPPGSSCHLKKDRSSREGHLDSS